MRFAVPVNSYFGTRSIVDTPCSHGFYSSHSDVYKLEKSAAFFQSKDIPKLGDADESVLIEYLANNVNLDNRTIDNLILS